MKAFSLPIRYSIPIAIFLLLMAVSLYELRSSLIFFNNSAEENTWSHARYEGSELAASLQYFIRLNNLDGAQKTISRTAEDPALIIAILSNEQGNILLSTRHEHTNRPIQEVMAEQELAVIKAAQKDFRISQAFSEDRMIMKSAFPLYLGTREGELKPSIIGILYLEHDLTAEKRHGKRIAQEGFYQFTAILCIICFLLWIFFERVFMARIQRLVEASKRLAAGDYHAQSEIKGLDEIGYLGESFDSMAHMLLKNRLELEHREEQIRLLLDSTAEAIYGIDVQGYCTFVNQAFMKILGYDDLKKVKGKKIHTLIHHSDKEGIPYDDEDYPILKALRESQGVHLNEDFIWKADGTSFPVEIWSHPILRKGEVLGAVITFMDIRERKREEILRQHLSQTEKLSSIGTFVSGIAHELNNPLTAVLGYSNEILQEPDLPEETKGILEIIATQTKRATDIVKSLLEFSRKETRGKTVTEINRVLETTIGFQRYRFHADNITVIHEFAEDLPPVEADINQLQQVFINIILNAHHAMKKAHGQGILTVRTSYKEGEISIEIENDGPHIPEAILPKIFDPFYTTKDVGEGTGLGLYVSYGIITEHGGSLYATNLPEKGVRFEITLPPAERKEIEKPQPVPEQTVIPVGTRVLLIEEEEDIRNWLASSLLKKGIFTMIAASVPEALKLIEESEFDIIISGTIMSDQKENLPLWLKSHKPLLIPKVIFATSYMEREIEAFCKEHHCSFIAKPYDLNDILGRMNTVLTNREEHVERS